ANSGLTDDEIERMVKDAEVNAEEDRRIAELATTRNQAEALVHSTRKSLEEYGDKLEASEKEAIEAAIKEVEEVLKDGDKEAIDAKVEALTSASQKLGEKMYADMQAQAAAQQGADGATAQQPEDENVVDADFKEVKRDDK
ncbi:MAG: molecular chaperone DnaK, partial [Alcaligenaceae bacterium]|nr:molecular chaperone DnaK [Alcaligenaceae bacterium]